MEFLIDSFWDTLKAAPILFLIYLLLEWTEQYYPDSMRRTAKKLGRVGPLVGALLGLIPQCGISAAAAGMFAAGVLSPGTLLSVFIATSDEAIPVLLAGEPIGTDILYFFAVKFFFAVLFGYLVDLLFGKRLRGSSALDAEAEQPPEGKFFFLKETVFRTIRILLLIFAVNILLGAVMEYGGNEFFTGLFLEGTLFTPFLAGLVGLIPNCAVSVVLTELYLAGQLSFAGAVAGLCTGAGVGLVVLFKSNKSWKQNLLLTVLLYLCGSLSGLLVLLCGIHP